MLPEHVHVWPRKGSLIPAPFASSRLFELAQVDFRGLRLPDLDIPATHDDLSEQRSRLAQRCLHVEVVEAGNAVFGNYDVEPPHGGAGRRVVDANVGDRSADDERIDAPQTQHVLQRRAVEGIVPWFADGRLVLARGELVHNLPAPAPLAAVLAPDLPLRVAIPVRILDEDHPHPGPPRQVQQALYSRYGSFGVGDDERAALLHEIVLHVPDYQGSPARVYPNAILYLVLRDVYCACHERPPSIPRREHQVPQLVYNVLRAPVACCNHEWERIEAEVSAPASEACQHFSISAFWPGSAKVVTLYVLRDQSFREGL